MTKKDYIMLAAVMKACRPDSALPDTDPSWKKWDEIIDELIPKLRADNPRFDVTRFMEACNA